MSEIIQKNNEIAVDVQEKELNYEQESLFEKFLVCFLMFMLIFFTAMSFILFLIGILIISRFIK